MQACWPASLADLVSSRFNEKLSLKNQDGKESRQTTSVRLWYTHTHTHKCMTHTHVHTVFPLTWFPSNLQDEG